MFTVGMNYLVVPGKERAFEAMFAKVIEKLDEAPGHDKSSLYRDVHEEGAYLVISVWNDGAAYQTFIRSEAFRRVTSWGREQILRGPPSHTVLGV